MKSKIHLEPSIAMMIVLTFVAIITVAVLSEVDLARRIDPRWVSAAALWILVVLNFWGVLALLGTPPLLKSLTNELQRLTTQVYFLRKNLEKIEVNREEHAKETSNEHQKKSY